jgi:hypothetical protein
MENISLILYTKGFFGSVLKSPPQMGSLSINNSVTNISRLGTFKLYVIIVHKFMIACFLHVADLYLLHLYDKYIADTFMFSFVL